MSLLRTSVLLLACAAIAYADIPVHCLEHETMGTWEFKHTPFTYDRSVHCASVSEDEMTESFQVTLDAAPEAHVTGSEDNQGFWTMIYDESFEVRINGNIWWAKFFYEGKHHYDCKKTMHGVVHETLTPGQYPDKYACMIGRKVEDHPDAPAALDMSAWRVLKPHREELLQSVDHGKIVETVNSMDLGWKAENYPAEMMSDIETAMRRQGPFPRVTPRAKANTGDLSDLPSEFDWRNVQGESFVGPVLNQGSCGSCYTFGSIGSINDRVRVKTGNKDKPAFAEQQILSCTDYAEGCEGGWGYNVGRYAREQGLVSTDCMPYHARSTECKFCSDPHPYMIDDYEYVGGYFGASTEEAMMKDIMTNGPLTISFMVTTPFMSYSRGIFHCKGNDELEAELGRPFELTNHLVLAVGWGEEDGHKFWIVRNSWGAHWGENGFFRIDRGNDCLAFESMPISLHV